MPDTAPEDGYQGSEHSDQRGSFHIRSSSAPTDVSVTALRWHRNDTGRVVSTPPCRTVDYWDMTRHASLDDFAVEAPRKYCGSTEVQKHLACRVAIQGSAERELGVVNDESVRQHGFEVQTRGE